MCKNLRFTQYFWFCAVYAKINCAKTCETLHAKKMRKSSQKISCAKNYESFAQKYGHLVETNNRQIVKRIYVTVLSSNCPSFRIKKTNKYFLIKNVYRVTNKEQQNRHDF